MVANPENVTETRYIGARIKTLLYERFREVAESEHRSVSGELTRLIEQRIAEAAQNGEK